MVSVSTSPWAAAAVIVVFIAMAIVNGLVTRAGVVKYSNSIIANTHPVYGLPSGYAFSVWGVIYTLQAIFCVVQALPSSLATPEIAAIRLPVIGLFTTNMAWLFLFGWETYWGAAVFIVAYDAFLFLVLKRLDVNFCLKKSWQLKLSAAAFGANASWVTIASCLQVQVNALEEGWLPSPDFALGLLFVSVCVASIVVFYQAEFVYAIVAAWALGGIISNQGDSSDFGCNTQICPACDTGISICDRNNTSTSPGRPNGFAMLNCGAYDADTTARLCVVDKSEVLAHWCYAGIAVVAVALVAGVVRGLLIRREEPNNAADTEGVALENGSKVLRP